MQQFTSQPHRQSSFLFRLHQARGITRWFTLQSTESMQRLRHDWRLIYDLTCGRTWAKWAGRSASYDRGAGAGPAGTAAAGPMLEAKLMNLIKGRLQKF